MRPIQSIGDVQSSVSDAFTSSIGVIDRHPINC